MLLLNFYLVVVVIRVVVLVRVVVVVRVVFLILALLSLSLSLPHGLGGFVLTLTVLRVDVFVIFGGGVAPKPPRLVWNDIERMHQCSW